MSHSPVPLKTPAGVDELKSRLLRLSQRHRTVLLLVDGRRTLSQVLGLAHQAGSATSHFEELLRLGLIELPREPEPPPPPDTGPGALDAPTVRSLEVDVQAAEAVLPDEPGATAPAPLVVEVALPVVEPEPHPALPEPAAPEPAPVLQAAPAAPVEVRAPAPAPAEAAAPSPVLDLDVPVDEPLLAPAPPPDAPPPRRDAWDFMPLGDEVATLARPPAPATSAWLGAPAWADESSPSPIDRGPKAPAPPVTPPATQFIEPALEAMLPVAPPIAQQADFVPRSSLPPAATEPAAPAPDDADLQLPAAAHDSAEERLLGQVRDLLAETLSFDTPLFSARMLVRVRMAPTRRELVNLVWEIERHLRHTRRAAPASTRLQDARELLGMGNTHVAGESQYGWREDEDE